MPDTQQLPTMPETICFIASEPRDLCMESREREKSVILPHSAQRPSVVNASDDIQAQNKFIRWLNKLAPGSNCLCSSATY